MSLGALGANNGKYVWIKKKKEREKRKYVKIKNGRAGRAESAKINVFVHY